ncbi:MAG: type IX secretion system protein PorQ [Saprospirales bacterium]|nr:type IX secretion system protein PorQ [Saprospirales bacterium]
MRSFILFLVFSAFSISIQAQIGGAAVYQFLQFAPSARVSALGGNLITVRDDDVNLAFANPALLNARMHHALSFSHNLYLAGIQNGYVAYGYHLPKGDITLHGGLQYVSYGTFDATDDIGTVTGDFKAAEYAITVGAGKQLYERLSVGANLKFVTSQLESYHSVGLAADLAATFFDTTRNFAASLVLRNIGGQLSTYSEGNREKIPYDMQVGISQRLRYLPFRFSIIYHHLHRWNVTYDDPNAVESVLFLGEAPKESQFSLFADNLFRHFIFSGEFLFGRNEPLRLRFGYNHLLRKELSVENFRSLTGFTFGIGIKVNRFRIDYGRGIYHLAGGLNHFTLSTNLSEFSTKRLLDK